MTSQPHFMVALEWQDAPPSGGNDSAEITIRLGQHVLTRLADLERETTRDFFRASATQLGLWFADNWWRLRWETISDPRFLSVDWRLRHELSSANGGTLWPPLMIYGAGDRVIFAPSVSRKATIGPQQYFDIPVGSTLGDEYEAEIDRLFESVVQHCTRSVDYEALATVVKQLRTERADPELSGWRRLEACLGFDPDQAPDATIEALIGLEDVAGEQGVEEAAIAAPGANASDVLQSVIDASRASTFVMNLELVDKIEPNREMPRFASPWQRAEDAAAELRRVIGFPRGPLRGKTFADILQVRWEAMKAATATARALPYAARLACDGGHQHVAMQTRLPGDRRFELARMMGDAIWSRGSRFGVVSRARTDRQKFQRAFAQSLLCPYVDLRDHVDITEPTSKQIEQAARHYRVHENVVRSLLVYKGVLPRQSLEDQLEAA